MNVKEFSKSKDGETYLAKNFQVKEFACQDGTDKILIDVDMIPILQMIRDIGGKLTINSAYRTPSHNKAVGGASQSFHLQGRAFDVVSKELSTDDVCDLCNTMGIRGIIKYPTFVHIDSRVTRYHADSKGNALKYGLYEEKALQYLINEGRITNSSKWHSMLPEVKWLIIKWSKDVRDLTSLKK